MQDPPKAKKMPKKESTHLVVVYMQHASCIPGQEQFSFGGIGQQRGLYSI